MTSYKDALVLLNDLKKYADDHNFPEAEKLIAQARQALDHDFGFKHPPIRKPKTETSPFRVVQ